MLPDESYLLQSLNPEQKEAVTATQGPLLVLAGAGTGKTKVLAHRISYIIAQGLARPYNILAVTFTNKAAREMHQRVNSIMQVEGVNIGTFHSICTRILRSNIGYVNADLNANFTIIDQDDQIKLVKNIAQQHNIDTSKNSPKLLHVIISKWKDRGLLPDKVGDNDAYHVMEKTALFIYKEYQKQLIAANLMDFGDILLYCNQLFINNPDILKQYQDRYKYILIDEYQDTNAVQYVWARMLANSHHNICCVGDDDQSIYSWRGAEVANILRFEKDFPEAKIVKLERNYRSSPEILAAASNVIQNNKKRHGKTLWTEQAIGDKISIVSCWNDREEARFIVAEIERLMAYEKFSANQMAILVRAGFQTRAFEEVLISNALPYQIIGGLRFYDRKEIRDALAYIRLCVNYNDNLALERIINVPKRSIGNVTLMKIKEYAGAHDISVFTAVKTMLANNELKGKTAESLQQFTNLIDYTTDRLKVERPSAAVKYLLENSGYIKAIKEEKTDDSRSRVENLNEMLRAIEEFENIQEFIEHSSLVMDNETIESDYGGNIKIMTLHAAKGLEFDVVFLPGWEEGIFPHQKSIEEDGEKGLEEERRIAYVGITRAKRKLYITHAENRRLYAEIITSIPSRFLNEIPDEICQRISSSRKLNYFGTSHNFSMQNSYSKPKARQEDLMISGSYRPGSKVKHAKFGHGIIVRKDGDNLEIAFEKIGLKTIKQDYVEVT
jgi:DNA helicase II / ATP-dependent DNA helicase PcrA